MGEGAASPGHISLHLCSPSPALLQHGLFSGGHKGDVFSARPSRCSHYTSNERLFQHKEHKSIMSERAQTQSNFSLSAFQAGENGPDGTFPSHTTAVPYLAYQLWLTKVLLNTTVRSETRQQQGSSVSNYDGLFLGGTISPREGYLVQT